MAESRNGRNEGKRKRRPYKLYNLCPDDADYSAVVPKTTKWRRGRNDDTQEANISCGNDEIEETNAVRADHSENDDEMNHYTNSDVLKDRIAAESIFLLPEPDNDCEHTADQDESNQAEHSQHNDFGPYQFGSDEPLYENSEVTTGQSLLLILAFILGNRLTGVAVGNLLRLLDLLLPSGSKLPKTKYLFYKHFDLFKEGMEFKLYCPCCKTLLLDDDLKCVICDNQYEQQKLRQQGNFFIYLPLEKQLQTFFQHVDTLDLEYRFNRKKAEGSTIDDIYDGQMYRSIANGVLVKDKNAFSISFSCDGVPIFHSSNFSIWPLQGVLNELPPNKRKQNVFLIGLWFGSGKPNIVNFLEPFTDEMVKLSTLGFKWLRHGQFVTSRIFSCVCSCDSVGRCILQNIHQFNGICGCSWCYNPGEVVEKGRGHTRVYLEAPEGHELRTHSELSEDAKYAFQTQEVVNGVKGPSKLLNLPHFDTVRGFVVDNLHCVDLGVARQLGHLWFDSVNHKQLWYLGKHIPVIDAKLKSVMLPHEVTRTPRSITQRSYWKGSEWHWWLLLYSPVILHGLLPSQYFRHLLLLVQGYFLLSKSSIQSCEIERANACLSKFVEDFERLYGKSNMTYNVHQLNHLAQTVIDWGPLSGYSMYIFEGFNQMLLKLFHGTQAVPAQIANSFLLYQALDTISDDSLEYGSGCNVVLAFLNAQLNRRLSLKKARRISDEVTLLGASYYKQLSIEEMYVVDECDALPNGVCEGEFFTKVVVRGNLFHCEKYSRDSRRKTSVVGLFVLVEELFCFAFGRALTLERLPWLYRETGYGHLCDHVSKVGQIEPALQVVDFGAINDKFAVFPSESEQGGLLGSILVRLPNIIDRD